MFLLLPFLRAFDSKIILGFRRVPFLAYVVLSGEDRCPWNIVSSRLETKHWTIILCQEKLVKALGLRTVFYLLEIFIALRHKGGIFLRSLNAFPFKLFQNLYNSYDCYLRFDEARRRKRSPSYVDRSFLFQVIELFLVRTVSLVVTDRIDRIGRVRCERYKWGCINGGSGGTPSLRSTELPTTPTPPMPLLSSECPLYNTTNLQGHPTQRSVSWNQRRRRRITRALVTLYGL